jgi:hypothetical protein
MLRISPCTTAASEEPTAEPERRSEDMQVVTTETLARQFDEGGRPVPEGGSKICFPRPFGDIFFAICVRQHPKREEPGKTDAPCVEVPGSSRAQHGSTPVQAHGILQRPEEQSRTDGCQGSNVAGQPQCPRLYHSSTPNARSLSHSPSACLPLLLSHNLPTPRVR